MARGPSSSFLINFCFVLIYINNIICIDVTL